VNNHKYISKYSNGKEVSAAQYITEIICEHKAKLDKLDLHYRFWINKKWSTFYRNQIASANQLLEKYSAKAIIAALNQPKASKIYSLRAPFLKDIIDQQEKILESQNQELTMKFDRSSDKKFKTNKSEQNIISKLKDLDNE
jgi:hypothetical protein